MPAKYSPPASSFLTDKDRADWHSRKQQFIVTDANEGVGKFGNGFTYTLVKFNGKTGEIGTSHFITMQENARRREEYGWFIKTLLESPDGVGPMILSQVDTDKGNPAWIFVAAD